MPALRSEARGGHQLVCLDGRSSAREARAERHTAEDEELGRAPIPGC